MKKLHAIIVVVAVNAAIVFVQLRGAVFAAPVTLKWTLLEFFVFLVPYSIMHISISFVICQIILGLFLLLFTKNRKNIGSAFENILGPASAISAAFAIVFVVLKAVGVA